MLLGWHSRQYSTVLAYNTCIAATKAPLQMFQYQTNIIPKWLIDGYANYIVDTRNKVVNVRTGKVLQMQLKGYTKGYYLSGKFMSLKQIRPLLKKYTCEQLPF
jgi:hypothetical protein